METFRISRAAVSLKVLMTVLLCMVGLIYLSLLANIYQDTEMKPSLIIEGYQEMEVMELSYNTHTYLPYYTLYLFALPVVIFMFSSYSEKLKLFFAVFPFLLILADITQMWFIPYVHTGFSYGLWCAGTLLSITFLILYILNIYDIWLRKS